MADDRFDQRREIQHREHGLTDDQLARATAALDAWYTNPGGSDYRGPGRTLDARELATMHAALEAPTLDDAIKAFGVEPDPVLSSPEQDAWNRASMAELRQLLGRS